MADFILPQRLQALPPYLFLEIDQKKKEALERGVDVIDLGVGDPDLPTPRVILEALHQGSEDPQNHVYPFGRGRLDFRKAIAAWFDRRFNTVLDPQQEILTLIGSKEGIGHAPLAFVNPGEVVLIPEPGYPAYNAGTVFAGAEPYFLPLRPENQFKPDFSRIPAAIVQRAKLLFLNYPNNPTAATADLSFFEEVVDWCRKHQIILAHDMAYSEIYFEGEPPPSVFQVAGAREIAIEFHSFSKTFSMAGWRLGFAVGRRELIDALARIKGNLDSGTVSAIQVMGKAALEHAEEIVPPVVQVYRERRDVLISGLEKAGLTVARSHATLYVWCSVPKGMTSMQFAARLLQEAGVVATPGIGFGPSGEGYIRFSLTTSKPRLYEAITRIQSITR